eukprot:6407029-Amphidinium_carterae.1
MSQAIGIHEPGLVVRQIGRPRIIDGAARARVCCISSMAPVDYGNVTLDASMSGGPTFFRPA